MADCSIPECRCPVLARGWCTKHYTRWRRYGDPTVQKKLSNGTIARWIKEHLSYSGDDCLIWPFYRQADGRAKMNGGVPARLICEKRYGTAPTSHHHAAHRCGNGNKGCVNPKHLYWATPAENIADKIIHGTQLRGEDAPGARLTEQDVREIRMISGSMPQFRIAAKYDVSSSCIYSILSGKNWRHVK